LPLECPDRERRAEGKPDVPQQREPLTGLLGGDADNRTTKNNTLFLGSKSLRLSKKQRILYSPRLHKDPAGLVFTGRFPTLFPEP
jgi:hypothetical protein